MKIKILLLTLFSFFLFHPIWAQDTAKPAKKNVHHTRKHTTNSHSDSLKISRSKSMSHSKDTIKAHNISVEKLPRFARSGYVALSAGFGIPGGDFASTGHASSGNVYSISAGFPGIISHFGIAFKFDYGTNPLNQTNYLSDLKNEINIPNINYSFTGIAGHFSYNTILTGIYLTYPGKKLSVDLRLLGGVMLATYPSFAVNIDDPNDGRSGTLYQSEIKGSAFAIDFGIEARYLVLPKLSIILSADYLHASPSFTDVATGVPMSVNVINTQVYEEQTVNQAYNLLNYSLGVGYTISAQKSSSHRDN